MMSQSESTSEYLVSSAEIGRNDSGLLVLSATRKVLYANKAGFDLLLRLHRQETGRATEGRLPTSVEQLIDEVLTILRIPLESRGWRRLAAKRMVEAPGHSISVQAFVGPQGLDTRRQFIVLTMK